MISTVAVVSCSPSEDAGSSPDQLASAADRLKPSVTKAERDDFIESCLADEGSAAFLRKPLGGFEGLNVTPFDEAAMTTCVGASFERWPNPPQPTSAADYEVLYDLYLLEVECLRDLGIAIDPPSLETYIDGDGFWTPYDDVPPPGSAQDWEAVNQTCPQDPWSYHDSTNPR